jgi:protein TonB
MNLILALTFLVGTLGLPLDVSANPSNPIGPSRAAHLFASILSTDREQDGLAGPVRRVRTETAKLSNKGGKPTEGQRAVLESVAYDIKGTKIESAYFPVPGATLTGKEVYKYDDKGNIVEMTLLNTDGSLMSKETYTYEFDSFGNWTKMTTSVAVLEGGKLSFEPTEVTYRTISYYLDEATLARMNQPAAPAQAAAAPAAAPAANTAKPAAAAAGKPATTLPAGASLIKTSVTAADAALRMAATGAGIPSTVNSSAVKLDEEPPPAQPAPKRLLRPVSGGVLNGKAAVLPKPTYPPNAKNMRASGLVVVEVVIDEAGKVIAAKAISGSPFLQPAAVQAAQGARFSPTLLSGQPVKVSGQINYNFSLTQ